MDLFGEEGAMFIRNLWYVAAWQHEIPADGLFSRVIIDVPLVFFRDEAGEVNVSSATPMVTLPMDKALVLFRRITEERLEAERPVPIAADLA